METEPKARSHHRKRRERAQRLQLEQSDTEVEQGADDNSPSRGPKERSRSKPRKKKNGPGTYEEDIIDGFAIVSFKSVDDLEKYTSGKLLCKKTAEKESSKSTCKDRCGVEKTNRRNHSLSPGRHKTCHPVKKKDKKKNVIPWSHKKHNSSGVDNTGESSGETTDNLDTSELVLNTAPNKTINRRRFSDVSTRSSSGDGYRCDSESGDERASDTSLDIFSSKPISQPVINHTVKCEPVITSSSIAPPLPVVSCLNNSVTTATGSVTSTTSDVTVTTVTTTNSCVSQATTLTVTSVTVSTAIPSVNSTLTTNSLNHHQQQQQHHHHHSQHQQHNSLPHHQNLQQHHHQQHQHQQHLHQHQQNQQRQHQQQVHPHHYNHQSVDNKYSQNHNHLQKPRSDREREREQREREQRERCSKASTVVKRRPPSPPPLTRSPPRQRIPSTPSTPLPSSSVPSLPPSSVSSASSSVISREPKRSSSPPLSRTPRREELRESPYQVLPPSLAVSKPFLPHGFPSHGATPPSLYSPLGPSPGLHLHSSSTPSQPGFLAAGAIPGIAAGSLSGVAGNPNLHPHHPAAAAAAATPTPQSVPPNMFAPPLPLGPHSGHLPGSVGGAPPAQIQPESPVSLTNSEQLREELNRRFLASQDRSSLLNSVPPFLRADIHQHMHQHQHQHQHTHQHTYHGGGGLPPPAMSASSLVPPPAPTPHPYDKMSSNPFFRQGLPPRPGIAEPAPRVVPNNKDKPTLPQHPRSTVPGLPGYPSMLLNPAGPSSSDALNSGIPGAFQPKGISGIPAVAGPVFMPVRDMDKSGPHLPATPSSSLPSAAKKVGKWCAVHVRIAWEIYNHQQQKQGDKGSEAKHPEPPRPPSHLLPGASSLQRPQELPSSAAPPVALLGSSRSLFDSSPHSLVNPASHVVPPSFQRPSPYSVASSLPLGLGSSSSATSRDPALSISSAPHEWNRIHRTPPTFQAEREREIREISLERRREEDRDRERRMMDHDRHRFSSLEDHGRDRYRDSDILNKSRSRSRSRSPMRNGRMEPGKSDRTYDRRLDDSANMLKIKEERRDSLTREDELTDQRDRLLKSNEYMPSNPLAASADPLLMQATMLDRVRMLTPGFLGGDRVPPPHPSLWNPFDKGPMDFPNHRLTLQREMERDHLLARFPGVPGMQPGFAPGLAALEQERLREELIMRDTTERAKRDYLERLPLLQRDRLIYENKMPGLRHQDPFMVQMGHPFARNMSPALGHHIKRSSPAVMPGAPPPLIHSVNTSQPRGHNSPAVNKTKGVSPTDSVGESKRDSNSNSTDPDIHSR